jgi:hypothetical protein
MAIPENILNELAALKPDIRAEVINDLLLSSAVKEEEIMVHTDRFFYRNFSKDVFDGAIDDSNKYKDILHLHLSRAGLYDLLPEGLFFKPVASEASPKTASEMALEYKLNKKQEQQIRKFFSPLENEFFRQRHRNFAEEKLLLNGLSNESLNRYFTRFWNLTADMMPIMALKFILLIPYIHQVAGNTHLMASSLQAILSEKVSCTLQRESYQQTGEQFNILGTFELGNELICGENYFEEEPVFVFTIHNPQQAGVQDFLEGGRLYHTLENFYRYFVPVNAGIVTNIDITANGEQMRIGNNNKISVLGISSYI